MKLLAAAQLKITLSENAYGMKRSAAPTTYFTVQ